MMALSKFLFLRINKEMSIATIASLFQDNHIHKHTQFSPSMICDVLLIKET